MFKFKLGDTFNSEFILSKDIYDGFISYFIGEELPVKEIVILSQDIKFKNPVYLNDILQLNVSVFEIYESVNVINFKFKFINQKNITAAKGKFQIKKLI